MKSHRTDGKFFEEQGNMSAIKDQVVDREALVDSAMENSGKYTSVIFLDIDGVLNDFDDRRKNRELIDENMVSRLKKIAEISGAKIILTSSWRMYYFDYNAGKPMNEHFKRLMDAFEKFDLTISGATDEIGIDKKSRPLEIRCWLLDKPDVERFVILDDMEWHWGWLSDHVVYTRRRDACAISGWRSGLDNENVQEALRILRAI